MKMTKAKRKHLLYVFVTYALVIAAYLILQSMIENKTITRSLKGQLVPICCWIVMAVSLNLVIGISGELSLGHAGFMSVGAFSGVVVSMSMAGSAPEPVRLICAILIGALLAGIAGVIIGIPVLRLNGDYLAIVTLAFGEIIKNVMNCLYVGVDGAGIHVSFKDAGSLGMAADGKILINGPIGANGVTKLSTFMAGTVLLIIVLIIIQNLVNSRTGLAIMAIRDNRIAAEASGVPVTKYKLIAFVTSAAIAGAAGALYALNYSTIAPKKFDFNTSILVLVFVVLGGIGNMTGSIIAAALLTILPELLRKFADYRMLIYAIVLIIVMIATNNEKVRAFVNGLKKKPTQEEAK